VTAYNFAKRLKTLRGLTPSEWICCVWSKQPELFRIDPTHQTSGQNPSLTLSSEDPDMGVYNVPKVEFAVPPPFITVPEPLSCAHLGPGLLGLWRTRRRRSI
jgi:hypothetical protein